jgi:hypothetical protein
VNKLQKSDAMLLFNAYLKCKGDVELASGIDGDYVKCLTCGFS